MLYYVCFLLRIWFIFSNVLLFSKDIILFLIFKMLFKKGIIMFLLIVGCSGILFWLIILLMELIIKFIRCFCFCLWVFKIKIIVVGKYLYWVSLKCWCKLIMGIIMLCRLIMFLIKCGVFGIGVGFF